MAYTFKGSDFIVLEHGQVIKGTNTYDTTTTLSNEITTTVSTGVIANSNSKVAIGCGRIVVGGASYQSYFSTTVGNAFIYDYGGNLIQSLTASDGQNGDGFGVSVGVAHDRVIVGSYEHSDIYVYTLAGVEVQRLTDTYSPYGSAQFGKDCDIGCGRIVGGAPESGSFDLVSTLPGTARVAP
jgi:hypothetical protein